MRGIASLIAILLSFMGASSLAQTALEPAVPGSMTRVLPADLPPLTIDPDTNGSDSKIEFQSALQKQYDRCVIQSSADVFHFPDRTVTRQQWCTDTVKWFLNRISTAATLEEVFQAAKKELQWYRSEGRASPGNPNGVLFTGYYHPSIKAKRNADATYRFPIYRMPSNRNFSRAEIVAGALQGKGLEIAYASNPVDPFVMEVQGSGALMLQNEDGTETRLLVNFGGTNGFPYTSLGKVMRQSGIAEEYINLQGIRRYFIDEHPEQWEKFSNQNQSFVFFRESASGPYGASGVLLTPGHSIAVDPSYFPLGAIALVQSERPTNRTGSAVDAWKPFMQFMIAQDTGGAIKGRDHVDIFWGSGEYAELVAGNSKQIGQLFFCLVP
jgi:membrane-bound lytic murein transglycosylase A